MANRKRFDGVLAVVLLVLVVFVSSLSSMSIEQANSKDEELSASSSRHKFVVMPSSLTRFLFYNTKPYERLGASAGSILDNKRSGNALDMITGMTMGKRSAPAGGFARAGSSVDFVNLEPLFSNQQYGLNMMPRMYDLPRWAPLEVAYEAASASGGQPSSQSNSE